MRKRNRLLDALPADVLAQLQPKCETLALHSGRVLHKAGEVTACNRLHSAEERYARWLLEVRDRIQSDALQLTQEFAGDMLGVRRASVNAVSRNLEKRKLIAQHRGLTDIIDGAGLEAVSCECYSVVKEEYDRLLGTARSEQGHR